MIEHGQNGGLPVLTNEEKQWGMFCHLSAFAGLLLPSFGHVLGPLVVWLLKKNEMPFVDDQGKESLNFQISMTLYWMIIGISALFLIGFLLVIPMMLVHVILTVMGAIKASNGEPYRYPLTIRFLQ